MFTVIQHPSLCGGKEYASGSPVIWCPWPLVQSPPHTHTHTHKYKIHAEAYMDPSAGLTLGYWFSLAVPKTCMNKQTNKQNKTKPNKKS